jgi:hypothetical protein
MNGDARLYSLLDLYEEAVFGFKTCLVESNDGLQDGYVNGRAKLG